MKDKIKQLLAEQDRIDTERSKIRNKISELEAESQNLLNESCQIGKEIERVKENGTSRFLGKYAKIGNPKWGHYVYMYIVSVANEYHGCIAAFNGPSFDYFGDVVHIRWSLESAHNSFCATIHDLNEIQIISKEEFLDAYNECANKAKNEFIKAISKTPIKKTTTQYKYEEDRYDVKE